MEDCATGTGGLLRRDYCAKAAAHGLRARAATQALLVRTALQGLPCSAGNAAQVARKRGQGLCCSGTAPCRGWRDGAAAQGLLRAECATQGLLWTGCPVLQQALGRTCAHGTGWSYLRLVPALPCQQNRNFKNKLRAILASTADFVQNAPDALGHQQPIIQIHLIRHASEPTPAPQQGHGPSPPLHVVAQAQWPVCESLWVRFSNCRLAGGRRRTPLRSCGSTTHQT